MNVDNIRRVSASAPTQGPSFQQTRQGGCAACEAALWVLSSGLEAGGRFISAYIDCLSLLPKFAGKM